MSTLCWNTPADCGLYVGGSTAVAVALRILRRNVGHTGSAIVRAPGVGTPSDLQGSARAPLDRSAGDRTRVNPSMSWGEGDACADAVDCAGYQTPRPGGILARLPGWSALRGRLGQRRDRTDRLSVIMHAPRIIAGTAVAHSTRHAARDHRFVPDETGFVANGAHRSVRHWTGSYKLRPCFQARPKMTVQGTDTMRHRMR